MTEEEYFANEGGGGINPPKGGNNPPKKKRKRTKKIIGTTGRGGFAARSAKSDAKRKFYKRKNRNLYLDGSIGRMRNSESRSGRYLF